MVSVVDLILVLKALILTSIYSLNIIQFVGLYNYTSQHNTTPAAKSMTESRTEVPHKLYQTTNASAVILDYKPGMANFVSKLGQIGPK